mgnify:CR=1 FL=1
MFSETKVTEIYYMADDFCKEFALQQEKFIVEDYSLYESLASRSFNNSPYFSFNPTLRKEF